MSVFARVEGAGKRKGVGGVAVLMGLVLAVAGSTLTAAASPASETDTWGVVATVPIVGPVVQGIAVNSVTGMVYTANAIAATVTVIDGATNTVVTTIPVASYPHTIAVNPITNTIYVSNKGIGNTGTTLTVINGVTNTVTTTVTVPQAPSAVAVNTVTNTIYVTSEIGSAVSVIDGTTNLVTASIPVADSPNGLAVDEATNTVYVAPFFGTGIVVISGVTDTITATIPNSAPNSAPWGMVLNPTTETLFVVNSNLGTVSVIDVSTNTVIATIPVGSDAQRAGIDPITQQVFVANPSDATVSVIDATTNTVVQTVPLGTTLDPVSAAVNTTTHRVYVNIFGNPASVMVLEASPVITSPTAAGTTTDTTPTITGTGVVGGLVTVTEGATTICTATVALDGSWSCTPSSPLSLGSHTLVATEDGLASVAVSFTVTALTAVTAGAAANTGGESMTNDGGQSLWVASLAAGLLASAGVWVLRRRRLA